MIESHKKRWFNNVFSTFVRERQIRPTFHNIFIRTDDIPTPGLILSTHSAWWDGLVMYMVNEHFLRHDIHVLMDEDGLRRFPFFRHLGAFSVKKGSLSDVRASLAYANELLASGKSVWMYPQGREVPQEMRPIEIESGATLLLNERPLHLCAMYYAFESHAEPVVYVRFRKYSVTSSTRRAQKQEIAQALEQLYDDVRDDVITRSTAYAPLFRPRRNLAEWTETFVRLGRKGS
ncbi:lysophospholipid acyltransferase family protein [Exiguobacterium sp. MMG028]|uniref:lysophospholipid acyltransferase family protein n=1 Tax=Exiguobacterium sp. MMG028 TaxID=3021979 RepID=UPI0022FF0371|nr:lysophospholipid acyltransferase family protein [Exiguobacterium sp. MMG028]MDA5560448.1 lysophospholipid acyltransferase family protein [Exiguobacterium sp. MMG028]